MTVTKIIQYIQVNEHARKLDEQIRISEWTRHKAQQKMMQ